MVSGVFTIPLDRRASPRGEESRGGQAVAEAPCEYVGGPENALVRIAADDFFCAHAAFPLLVLCGPSGAGKTHLARGLAGRWPDRARPRRVVVTTGADFARAYATAVESDGLEEFRERFRAARLAVVDGLTEMAGKRGAQEELARSLDELLDGGGRAIVTSPAPPHELPGLLPALASRLACGLVVPLALPGPEVRRELLARLAAESGLKCTDEAVAVLSAVPASAGELRGAVLRLATLGKAGGGPIEGEAARAFLAEWPPARPPTVRRIARLVSRRFRVKLADLAGPTRRQSVVFARGIAMHLAREATGQSLEKIGAAFGGRDHTTVLHACRKTEKMLAADSALRGVVAELRSSLSAAGTE